MPWYSSFRVVGSSCEHIPSTAKQTKEETGDATFRLEVHLILLFCLPVYLQVPRCVVPQVPPSNLSLGFLIP